MNPIIKHRLYLKNNWLSFFPESIHDLVLGSVRWGVRGHVWPVDGLVRMRLDGRSRSSRAYR